MRLYSGSRGGCQPSSYNKPYSVKTMMLWSPLQALPREYARWPLLALMLAVSLWLGARAGGEGRLYNKNIAPRGMVSLVRAGDEAKAKQIIAFWDRWVGRQFAIDSVKLDFIFAFIYSTTLALACVIAADRFSSIGDNTSREGGESAQEHAARHGNLWKRLGNLGIILAWMQWGVALLNLLENYLLLKMLKESPTNLLAKAAWLCGDLKFSLVLLGIVYASLGAVIYWTLFLVKPRLINRTDGNEQAVGISD